MSASSSSVDTGWAGLFWEAFRRSRNPMVLLDEHRCHVAVNGAYLQLLGYPRSELIGKPFWHLVPDGPMVSESRWRELIQQERFTGTGELVTADGGRLRVEFAAHPEVVTGRRLVLGVAIRSARGARRLRDPGGGPGASRPELLTERELDVIRLVALGLSGPEIAEELNVAHNTVRTHVRNAMTKLGSRSRAQMVAQTLAESVSWPVRANLDRARVLTPS